MPWTIELAHMHPRPAGALALEIPAGPAVIRGRSGAGKSTLIVAYCLAMTGAGPNAGPLDPSRMAGGPATTVAAVTLPTGLRIGWSCALGGKPSRSIQRKDTARESATPAEVAAALGQKAGDAALVRAVGVPYWLSSGLTDTTVTGQPYRALLARLLAGPDAVAAWLAARLQDGEPADIKSAEKAQTLANSAADRAQGALDALTGEPETEPIPPDADAVEAAQEAVQRHADDLTAWRTRQAAYAAVEAQRKAADAATAARADWTRRHAEVEASKPRSPKPAPEDVGRSIAARDEAAAAVKAIDAKAAAARSADADRKAAAQADAVPCRGRMLSDPAGDDADCSTCPALASAIDARQRLASAVAGPTAGEVAEVYAAAQRAEEAATAIARSVGAWRTWEAASAALGACPAEVVTPPDAPAPGPEPKVNPAHRALLERAATADALHAAWSERQRTRDARLAAARAELAAAQTKAARAKAVVGLVRGAAGHVLHEALTALHEHAGDVVLQVSDTSATLYWRGRPWGALSQGERLVADVELRDALRVAVRAPWLPLWVDDAQLATGPGVALPDTGGRPTWVLRGDDSIDALEVSDV